MDNIKGNIKVVDASEDDFGSALVQLLELHGIKTFIFSGVGEGGKGVTSVNFEQPTLGVTALALLVRAVPELFLLFEEAKLGAYVHLMNSMLSKGEPGAEEASGDLLKDFTVTGKLKN